MQRPPACLPARPHAVAASLAAAWALAAHPSDGACRHCHCPAAQPASRRCPACPGVPRVRRDRHGRAGAGGGVVIRRRRLARPAPGLPRIAAVASVPAAGRDGGRHRRAVHRCARGRLAGCDPGPAPDFGHGHGHGRDHGRGPDHGSCSGRDPGPGAVRAHAGNGFAGHARRGGRAGACRRVARCDGRIRIPTRQPSPAGRCRAGSAATATRGPARGPRGRLAASASARAQPVQSAVRPRAPPAGASRLAT